MPGNNVDLTLLGHHVRTISVPLVGAEFQLPTPDGFTAMLIGLNIVFQTDATVANRQITIQNTQGSNHCPQIIMPCEQPAGTIYQYHGGIGVTAFGPSTSHGYVQCCIPNFFVVRPGDILKSYVVLRQATDAWTTIQFAFMEWLSD
jgi:hypothetical protein